MHSIKLDIRWPIGILFSFQGALLAVYGSLDQGAQPAGVNAAAGFDVRWGLVMLAFGVLMLALAFRHRRREGAAVSSRPPTQD